MAAVERAIDAGRLSNVPVMLDSHIYSNSGRDTRRKVLELMRPGDIHTHTYTTSSWNWSTGSAEKCSMDDRGADTRRAVRSGPWGGSFLWPVARAAISQALP